MCFRRTLRLEKKRNHRTTGAKEEGEGDRGAGGVGGRERERERGGGKRDI